MTASFWSSAASDAAGWTLVHFLWQGTALAALFYVFLAFTRSPRARHNTGVITLLMMAASPLITFFVLASRHRDVFAPSKLQLVLNSLGTVATADGGIPVAAASQSILAIDWVSYLLCAWLTGVLIFGMRALGGYLVLGRLLREKCEPLCADLEARCRELQRALGLTRTVRYVQSRLVCAPSVAGWFRPVILIPLSALSGLSSEQLEAVLVHELAHIQRFDAFVNFFQIMVETLLFYHPGVWWVSRSIRNERENCCDDIAVQVSGEPGAYVRALAMMEGWRATPAFVLAANNGPLKNRAGRILGLEGMARSVPQGGLAIIGCLCVAGAVFGASTFSKEIEYPAREAAAAEESVQAPAPQVPSAPEVSAPVPVPAPKVPARPAVHVDPAVPPVIVSANDETPDEDRDRDEEQTDRVSSADKKEDSRNGSYIDDLKASGLKDLTVDNLIAMKVQGITPQYVREMREAGFNTSPGELIAMKVQGITPEYVKRVRAGGWKDATLGQIIAMKVQDIDPAEAREFQRELGVKDLSLGHLIAFKVQGITPDYIRGMRAAGIRDLSPGQIVAAKVQGVTPEFVRKVRDHGFLNLSLQQLIGLRVAGVF